MLDALTLCASFTPTHASPTCQLALSTDLIDQQTICFRQNFIKKIEHLENLGATLTELDLRDNEIERIEGLETLRRLEMLDVSYNTIRKVSCPMH